MKNKLAILVAIAVGLAAVILIFHYINENSLGDVEETKSVPIVVAKRKLPAGRILRRSDWEVEEVSVSTFQKARNLLIKAGEIGTYDGRVLTMPYRRGEYLSSLTFAGKGSPGDFAIEEGSRAVTINVDDVSGVAGLIRPKDRVDVVIVQRLSRAVSRSGGAQPASKSERIRVTVFRNALVLATGRQTTTLNINSVGRGGYRTVTFELPEEKALLLAGVQNFAMVTLMLRGKSDLAGKDIRIEVDSANLLETLEELKKKSASLPGD